MPCPLLDFSKSDWLIQVVNTNSQTEWQTMQIQKPTDLDLHCLQMQGISGFSRIRVKFHVYTHFVSSYPRGSFCVFPAGTWRLYNVLSMLMQCHNIASTLKWCCTNIMCLLGRLSWRIGFPRETEKRDRRSSRWQREIEVVEGKSVWQHKQKF